MTFDPEFLGMMPHEITVRKLKRDEDGKPVRDLYAKDEWDTPFPVPCQIEGGGKRVRTSEGNEETAGALVITGGFYDIKAEDEITMPDGSKPVILDEGRVSDEAGWSHQEIALR